MDHSLRELVRTLDLCIRSGQARLAREELHRLDLKRVPRAFAAPLAAIARRAALPDVSLTLLHPYVRDRPEGAQQNEIAEYAAALTYLGGSDEAMDLLSPLDPIATPQSLLYRSFTHFAQWDYAAAIPLLTRYLRSPEVTGYWKRVGMLNLVSALVYEQRNAEADPLIGELIEETGYPGNEFLRASVLEISAQLHIAENNLLGAQKLLLEARANIRRAEGLQDLFVRKWRAVLELRRSPRSERALAQLRLVKAEARKQGHWETVRDCDRYDALGTRNKDLVLRLYFGTPFESFRRRLLSEFQGPVPIPEAYDWSPSETSLPAKPVLWDIEGASQLRPLPRQLVSLLCSDFYSPFRLAALFFKLFRGKDYLPGIAEDWVRKIANQLREDLTQHVPLLNVIEENGALRLTSAGTLSIRVRRTFSQREAA